MEGDECVVAVDAEKGLTPNEITYTTLMDSYGNSKRWQDASDCLSQMKEQGLKPPTAVYCALANAYAKRVSPTAFTQSMLSFPS